MVRESKFYLTKQGLAKAKEEYEKLRHLRGLKSQKGAPAILHSEELNTEFVSFREDMDLLDARLDELEYILKHFELIKPPPKKERNKVCIGASVDLEIGGQKDRFTLVGTLEADPSLGRISNESPVGKALLGHKVGDEISLALSNPHKIVYKIKKIEYTML